MQVRSVVRGVVPGCLAWQWCLVAATLVSLRNRKCMEADHHAFHAIVLLHSGCSLSPSVRRRGGRVVCAARVVCDLSFASFVLLGSSLHSGSLALVAV